MCEFLLCRLNSQFDVQLIQQNYDPRAGALPLSSHVAASSVTSATFLHAVPLLPGPEEAAGAVPAEARDDSRAEGYTEELNSFRQHQCIVCIDGLFLSITKKLDDANWIRKENISVPHSLKVKMIRPYCKWKYLLRKCGGVLPVVCQSGTETDCDLIVWATRTLEEY